MNASAFQGGLFSFIWKFIRPQRWKFLLILIVSFAWSIDATVWPYLLRIIIDILTNYESSRSAVWPALTVPIICGFFLWLLIDASFRVQGWLLARALPKLEADIRMEMFDHIQRHSPKYFNEKFAGSLANKITDMTTQVSLILTQLLWMFLPACATCIFSLCFFSGISWIFSLTLAIEFALFTAVCCYFTPKCQHLEHAHGEARSKLLGKIVDSLTNNFAVNLFFRFRFEKKTIGLSQNEEEQKNFQAKRIVEIMRIWLSWTFILGSMAIFAEALHLWIREGISTGGIVQVFNMTWNLVLIMWLSGTELPAFFQSVGLAKQAMSVMRDPQDVLDVPSAKPLIVTKGEIVFDTISFRYNQKMLFENKSVHIRGGEKVGLVGYSGAGKSSFVNLILRFFPLNKGKILIDGQEIARVSLESLRSQVALIPQDPLLFHRTLEENIRYGREDATQQEVFAAARQAHCDEFIKRCPEGYATLVGERGTKLSGGERQRIAIARAMLAKAPILILDEATSALDSVTERYIQESLEKLMEKRTTLVIAHRLSTLAKMDRILVFERGVIVEEGSHAQLLDKGGHYARMWKMQAGGFLPEKPQELK